MPFYNPAPQAKVGVASLRCSRSSNIYFSCPKFKTILGHFHIVLSSTHRVSKKSEQHECFLRWLDNMVSFSLYKILLIVFITYYLWLNVLHFIQLGWACSVNLCKCYCIIRTPRQGINGRWPGGMGVVLCSRPFLSEKGKDGGAGV